MSVHRNGTARYTISTFDVDRHVLEHPHKLISHFFTQSQKHNLPTKRLPEQGSEIKLKQTSKFNLVWSIRNHRCIRIVLLGFLSSPQTCKESSHRMLTDNQKNHTEVQDDIAKLPIFAGDVLYSVFDYWFGLLVLLSEVQPCLPAPRRLKKNIAMFKIGSFFRSSVLVPNHLGRMSCARVFWYLIERK